jgi:FAD/FMN-containing dehydrogenase
MIAKPLDDSLRAIVGDTHVITDADVRATYEVDWTRRFSGTSACVVRPANTTEVAEVLLRCSDAGVPVVTQGGNTGMVGGGVPRDREVLLSTVRLDNLHEVDAASAQVSAGAGVTLSHLQNHVRLAGFDFGVDLAARESATVGGMVATNAGGIRVLRHGSMRAQVIGLEAVFADGSVVRRMSGLIKDNAGYDLPSLLVGSEGTLAVITAARLRLVPPLGVRAAALVGVDDAQAAVSLLSKVRDLGTLAAAEVFFAEGLDLVRAHTQLPNPLPAAYPTYVLLEVAARPDPCDEFVKRLSECSEVRDAVVANDVAGQQSLWRYREAHTEAISAEGIPLKLDVSVPIAALAELVAALPTAICAVTPDARLVLFGHLNEGNIHVNVLNAEDCAELVTEAVLRLVSRLNGSISAEHGVGRAKVGWLSLTRSPEEIAAMRAIKCALDPKCLLNPGVLFDDS